MRPDVLTRLGVDMAGASCPLIRRGVRAVEVVGCRVAYPSESSRNICSMFLPCVLPIRGAKFRLHAAVVERQTRGPQAAVPYRAWRFESSQPHWGC